MTLGSSTMMMLLWMGVIFSPISLLGWSQAAKPAVESPLRITINDNRVPSGTLAGRTLTIHLEALSGEWHPDGDSDPGVVVKAFAIEGGRPQIPGPLIRVAAGTEIRAFIRNSFERDTLAIHGMYSRPGNESTAKPIVIPAGVTQEVRFLAGSPGTYYYWGSTDSTTLLNQRLGNESQLTGAFIVDPTDGPPQPDRVLLISGWNNGTGARDATAARFAINGRSWPQTERLSYRVGDSVRLRLINASGAVHPMHLHGFYFNVDSRGDERADTIFPPNSSPHMVVTERAAPGRTFSLTWKPTRPGNWLFHCHDNVHLQRLGSLDGQPLPPSGANHHVENHALEMMAGPVMGIIVGGDSMEAVSSTSDARRRLQLTARVDTGGTEDEPAFGYTLDAGESSSAPPPPYLPGPTIVLKVGEPVSITVVNQLPEPTSVHWHGIELESYYDGVAGFAGVGSRIAPAIEPGGSFEALFTPPRSGTFIYRAHIDEVRQQKAGLSGALLVVDSPESYDPEHDLVLMVTVPRKNADAQKVLLNGFNRTCCA